MTDDIFASGVKALIGGDLNGAEVAFKEVLSLEPFSSEAMLNLGNVYYKLQKYPEAEAQWAKLINIDPMQAKVYLNLGNLYFQVKKYPKALYYWNIFKKLDPIHDTINLNLGLAYEATGQLVKAYKHYMLHLHSHAGPEGRPLRARIDQAKQIAEHNLKAAEELMHAGKLEKARQAFQGCVNLVPLNPKIYKHYATVLYQLQDYKEAGIWYEKAYEEMEHDVSILVNLGVIYERLENPLQALWCYVTALRINANKVPPAVRGRYQMLWTTGGRKLLMDSYEQVKQLIQNRHYEEAELLVRRLWDVCFVLDKEIMSDIKVTITQLTDRRNPKRQAANIAYALGEDMRKSGQFEKAMLFYSRYLDVMPEGDRAKEVLERKVEMEATISKVLGAMLAPEDQALDIGHGNVGEEVLSHATP